MCHIIATKKRQVKFATSQGSFLHTYSAELASKLDDSTVAVEYVSTKVAPPCTKQRPKSSASTSNPQASQFIGNVSYHCY
mmetsp:Transcript_625/g.823  ORF Transcript_625/g.823 Transcript_625/m.823 type:complete len:80 (-) Transcript_625:81-320(-)